ncbi:hypothetical protein [Eubacterium ventriosum]|jgi:hypothetical protein|uniref:hypothetical protein n=1 Tax=Eubacterium ventriosum TaxID=39496 RepID=UPI0015B9DBF6|nr:hypothetical protein [Eubacterium ventriosum]
MEADIREIKRAKNFIWASAEDYELNPLYLAFSPDGKADTYLNIIIGLSYKWYDGAQLEEFFNVLGGKDKELFEGLFWIGLEKVLFKKEKDYRMALTDLRVEYAKETVRRFKKYTDNSLIEKIRYGYCRQILGKESNLSAEEEELLSEFDFSNDMTTEQIIGKTKKILSEKFSYTPSLKKNKEGVYFLQKVLSPFRSVGKVSATYVRTKKYDEPTGFNEGKTGVLKKGKNYLLQFSLNGNPKYALEYVQSTFGKNMYNDFENQRIEEKLCTGKHKESHLLFTKGKKYNLKEQSRELPKKEIKEILEFRRECKNQYEKNKEYFEKNRPVYKNSINRLSEKLRITLDSEREIFPLMSNHGKINGGKIWQALYVDNPRVFEKKEQEDKSGFSVDIMIDGSSSRKNSQEFIAAQVYVLAKSLERCNIPCQIYSYCSIRGYTVLRIFKDYSEQKAGKEIFKYVAAGNNRDGLALKGAGHLMEHSPKGKRILVVLTDASPQDDQSAMEGAFYKNNEYTDELAIKDTEKEIHNLKSNNIQVIGIFMGSERGTIAAKEIFGKDFVKIETIHQFSDAVGRILQEKIRNIN